MKRLLGLCATVLAALCLTGCASQKKVAYLCAYMTGHDERHLYYAVADTAFRFHPVNDGQPVLGASFDDRLVRDPHLFRDRQGCYHMVATVSWKNHPFTIWDSRDLIRWENERLIDAAPEGATKTWAPELAYDEAGDQYFAYWTADIGGDFTTAAIYYATTRDFREFSRPQVLYREKADGILDANIIKVGDTYHLFYRHQKQIWAVTSKSALGPYGNRRLVTRANVEGPYVFPLNDGTSYAIVWDYYGGSKGFGLATSKDLHEWHSVTNRRHPYYNDSVCFPHGIRHGSIMGITKRQLKAINNMRKQTK